MASLLETSQGSLEWQLARVGSWWLMRRENSWNWVAECITNPYAEPPCSLPSSLSSATLSSNGSWGKPTMYTLAPFVTRP